MKWTVGKRRLKDYLSIILVLVKSTTPVLNNRNAREVESKNNQEATKGKLT